MNPIKEMIIKSYNQAVYKVACKYSNTEPKKVLNFYQIPTNLPDYLVFTIFHQGIDMNNVKEHIEEIKNTLISYLTTNLSIIWPLTTVKIGRVISKINVSSDEKIFTKEFVLDITDKIYMLLLKEEPIYDEKKKNDEFGPYMGMDRDPGNSSNATWAYVLVVIAIVIVCYIIIH